MECNTSLPEYSKGLEKIIEDIYQMKFFKLPGVAERLEEMIRYNIPNYCKYRGYLVALAYSQLHNGQISQEQFKLASILGWCYQIVQGYLTLVDEYYDNDEIRFGKPTWHYKCLNHPISINDSLLLPQVVQHLLIKYFSQHPNYLEIIDYFNTISLEYCAGQSQDLLTETINENDQEMSQFTMDKYNTFVKILCDKYTSGMPHLAMLLAEYSKTDELWDKVDAIVSNIASFWKIRDDLIDSFGENLIIPLYHNDIKLGKFTWLIVKAKELANPEQWNKLKQFYGKKTEDCVAPVIEVYKELDIPNLCKMYLKELEDTINSDIKLLADQGHQIYDTLRRLQHFYNTIKE